MKGMMKEPTYAWAYLSNPNSNLIERNSSNSPGAWNENSKLELDE
jgi:hypothetical protein